MLQWTKDMSKDGVGDGWDPTIPYQLIPVQRKRFMSFRNSSRTVKLEVSQNVSCGLTKERSLSRTSNAAFARVAFDMPIIASVWGSDSARPILAAAFFSSR